MQIVSAIAFALVGIVAWVNVSMLGSRTLAGFDQCQRFYSLPFGGCRVNSGDWIVLADIGTWAAAFAIAGVGIMRWLARRKTG